MEVLKRSGGESNLLTQVRHVNRSGEATVGVTVVDVHDVDTSGFGTFLHQVHEQFLSLYRLTRDGLVGFVTQIECVELGLTEGVVETRSVVGTEQGDVLVVNETSVEQFRDLDGVVELTNSVVLGSLVVLEDHDVLNLFVPDGEVDGGRTTTDTILGTGTDTGLEVLQEGDDTRVGNLTTLDLGTQGTNTTSVDTDTGTLAGVLDDGRRGGNDGIQSVVRVNQNTGGVLTGWGTNTRHDRSRDVNHVTGYGVVVTLHITHTDFLIVTMEDGSGDKHVHELGGLVDNPS